MHSLTYHGQPVSNPQKHRETCIVEALERGVIITGRFSHNVTNLLKDGWDIVEVSKPIMDESGFQIGEVCIVKQVEKYDNSITTAKTVNKLPQ